MTDIIIPSYVQSACKLFKAAEECRLARDEERAYVLYMKYLTVYDIIKKRPDFKSQLVWLASVKCGVFVPFNMLTFTLIVFFFIYFFILMYKGLLLDLVGAKQLQKSH